MSQGDEMRSVAGLAQKFAELWGESETPDVFAFLANNTVAASREKADVLLVDQNQRWQLGRPRPLEEYFAKCPDVASNRKLKLELVREEFGYVEAAEQSPNLHQFISRFPDLRDELLKTFQPSEVISDTVDVSMDRLASTIVPTRGERRTPSEPSGKRFGDYELLDKVAQGGMGVVYKARQTSLNRIVALKMIRAGELASDEDVQRFKTEAEAAAKLDHPSIVPVFEVGDENGQHFFSMGFVEGQSLQEVLKDGPFPPREAAALVKTLSAAVHYAHEKGIVHRDLKPSNVLMEAEGKPRITDFGLAKTTTEDSGMTATGQILGTPSYMPPEQAAGRIEQIGPGADVYSLGAILYCMITGRPPFQAASVMETLKQVLEQEPVSPRTLNPAVDRDLETICLKCLDKQASRRYDRAKALVVDLDHYLAGRPILARPVGRPTRCWRWCKRNPIGATLIGLLFSVAIAGPAVALNQMRLSKEADDNAKEANERAIAEGRERKRANQEADNAKKALANLKEQKAATDAALVESRRQTAKSKFVAYAFRLSLANQAVTQGRLEEAREILSTCDRSLLGWEYDHVVRKTLPRMILRGHTHGVRCIAISPDGRYIASGSRAYDEETGQFGLGEIRLWDASTGTLLRTLTGHTSFVLSLSFSPDSSQLLSGSYDRTVKQWDVSSGQVVRTLQGHQSGVSGVCFSPDGSRIASGSKSLMVWNTRSGDRLLTIDGGNHSLCFSPDNKRIAGVTGDNRAKVWDATTGKEVFELRGHTKRVTCLAYSPTGKQLATGSYDKLLKVWDAATGQETASFRAHGQFVGCVAFSPDGARIVSGSRADNAVRVWQAASGKEILTHKQSWLPVEQVAFSSDGLRIVIARSDKSVHVCCASPERESLILKGDGHPVSGIALSPDGRRVAGCIDRSVTLWSAINGKRLLQLRGGVQYMSRVTFSPDGALIAGGGSSGEVKLWDSYSGLEIRRLRHQGGITCASFSPDGKRLLVGTAKNLLKVWDVTNTDELLTLPGREGVFSADGSQITSNAPGEPVRHFDAKTGSEIYATGAIPDSFRAVVAMPNDQRVVGASGNTLQIWDLRKGEGVETLRGHSGSVVSVAVSPDGRRIVSGSRDKTVKIWDAQTGEVALTLEGHSGGVSFVAFSPDGKRIASASYDGTVRFWDATTGDQTRTLRHDSGVHGIAWSPDGRQFVSHDNGGTRIWNCAAGRLLSKYPGSTDYCRSAATSPDGRWIARANIDRSIDLCNGHTGAVVRKLKGHEAEVSCLEFSPSSRLLVSSCGKTLKIWSVGDGRESLVLEGIRTGSSCVAFDREGKRLATVRAIVNRRTQTTWCDLLVWDVRTGALKLVIPKAHQTYVSDLAFSPDGRSIASGGGYNKIRIWDPHSGDKLRTLNTQGARVWCLDYSPDGRWIVSGDQASMLTVWDSVSGKRTGVFTGHTAGVTSVAFSPDGSQLSSGSQDHTARFWDFSAYRDRPVTAFRPDFEPIPRPPVVAHRPKPTTARKKKPRPVIAEISAIKKLKGRVFFDFTKKTRSLSTVRTVWLHNTSISDEDLALLKRMTNLQRLSLGRTKISDSGLKHIAELTSLKEVRLYDTQIGDAGLQHLMSLRQLESLYLSNTKVTAKGLTRLAGLKALTDIKLENTRVGDDVLRVLANHPLLEDISLAKTLVTDSGLTQLAKLTKLKRLDLQFTKVTEAGVKMLQTSLPMCRIKVTKPDIWALEKSKPAASQAEIVAEVKKLRATVSYYTTLRGDKLVTGVSVYSGKFTDAGVAKLAALKHLRRIALHNTQITDAGLAHLKGLSYLQSLGIGGTKVTSQGLRHLKGLTQLNALTLTGTKVTDPGLGHLSSLGNLERLFLGDTKVTDQGLTHLKGLKKLRWLSLRKSKVTGRGVQELKTALPNCKVFW